MSANDRWRRTDVAADAHDATTVLFARVDTVTVAIPLASVIETLRPLPVVPLANTPLWVRGAAIVRGESIPVVHLGALMGNAPDSVGQRFIIVSSADRRVALEVTAVLGVAPLARATLRELPPLLGTADSAVAQAVAVRDGALLVLLQAARLVPPDSTVGSAAPKGS